MITFKKTAAAAVAALTMAIAFAPASAEARWHRGGGLFAAGLIGAAVVGTAIAASNANAGYAGSECYRTRERVWDEYRGRFVIVRRTVCE